MLSPKPRAELPAGLDDFIRPDSRVSDEVRSFAPRSGVATRSRWEAPASWPSHWLELDPARLIQIPPEAANAAPNLDLEASEKRALIVIPCLNEAAGIARVIERILQDERLVDPLVLVADGGSEDGSREIVGEIARRDPRVRLLDNPGRLQSAGVNLAARTMGEDRLWLVRIDAHADYPPDYVSTLLDEARRTGAHSVVVAMDTQGETRFQRAVAAAQNSLLGTGGAAHRVGAAARWVDHGHHALFSREAFQAVGGYDESFSHNEDAELDLRLSQEGARIWLTDKTRLVYHPRRTPGALWRQYLSYGKGRARTVLKHYTPLKMRQALPLAVAPAVLGALATPLFWPLVLPALIWAVVALGYGVMLAIRQRDPAILLSGPAAMIMHLGWSTGFWLQVLRWAASGRSARSPSAPVAMPASGP